MPSNDKPPLTEKARREAKLAQALRANLRRRKSGTAATPPAPRDPPDDDPC